MGSVIITVAEPDRMADLLEFARLEVASCDLEPWAMLLRALRLAHGHDNETALWLVKLYNSFDSFGSAYNMFRRWPTPGDWDHAQDKAEARDFPHMLERRNLHGGRGCVRFQSYCDLIGSRTQEEWFQQAIGNNPLDNFLRLMTLTRRVWGVGRLAAFEWVEFLGKVMDWPIHAPDGQLWESSGPRLSLQRLYGNENPTPAELTAYAEHCRSYLADNGVPLHWEDFETVVCDFNVGRGGRYYPGKHLAALRGEIDEVPEPARSAILEVWHKIIPEPWNRIGPGIDKSLMPKYRDTGRWTLPVQP